MRIKISIALAVIIITVFVFALMASSVSAQGYYGGHGYNRYNPYYGGSHYYPYYGGGPRHHNYNTRISSGRAADIALRSYPGRVVGNTRLVNMNGRLGYEVNIRSNRGIERVFVDAYSGRILSAMNRGYGGRYRY